VRVNLLFVLPVPFDIQLHRSSNKMPVAVKEAIRFAVERHGGSSGEEAQEFMAAMEREGKIIEECWS